MSTLDLIIHDTTESNDPIVVAQKAFNVTWAKIMKKRYPKTQRGATRMKSDYFIIWSLYQRVNTLKAEAGLPALELKGLTNTVKTLGII